jgi:hypothetical protein
MVALEDKQSDILIANNVRVEKYTPPSLMNASIKGRLPDDKLRKIR